MANEPKTMSPAEVRRLKQRIELRKRGLDPNAPQQSPAQEETMDPGTYGSNAAGSSSQAIGKVIDVLCEADDDQVVAELDRKITDLESQLAKLRRVKKMLVGRQAGGSGIRREFKPKADGEQQIAKMLGVLKRQGPQRCKELAAAIGETNFAYVGKLARASDQIRKRDDGKLEAAQ